MSKIKLPLTDKFLWALYKALEKAEDAISLPEIFQLKGLGYTHSCLGADFWRGIEKKRRRGQFAQLLYYLKKHGLITTTGSKQKRAILLTPKGRQKILRIKFLIEDKKRRKDGKWIMMMYDIPEKKSKLRTFFRGFLRSLGYQNLQKSVWVSPYDVLNETEEIVRIYSLDRYVRIFLIEEI